MSIFLATRIAHICQACAMDAGADVFKVQQLIEGANHRVAVVLVVAPLIP
jgi:hypothetical protein